jgi:DNA (cytosine-5)-methyltransferase 1
LNVDLRPYNLLSLCAGSGALDLGIGLACPSARTICMVERGAYQAELLAARMEFGDLPEAPIWSDLASFDPGPWRGVVDCIASGDPCQPNSLAGQQRGADDDRWLLDHVLRVISAVRPNRFFRENVPGHADNQIGYLVPALEELGYRVACGMFSARAVGSGQPRERLYLMADRDGAGSQVAQQPSEPSEPSEEKSEFKAGTTTCELRGLGTAGDVVDDHRGGGARVATHKGERTQQRTALGWAGDLAVFAPRPRDPAWRNIIRDAPGLKPAIRRVADGVAYRMDRIETAGNGVVPVVAARAWLGLEARLAGASGLVRLMADA